MGIIYILDKENGWGVFHFTSERQMFGLLMRKRNSVLKKDVIYFSYNITKINWDENRE